MLLLRELKAFPGVEGLKTQVEGDKGAGREARIRGPIEGLGFAKDIGRKISKDLAYLIVLIALTSYML